MTDTLPEIPYTHSINIYILSFYRNMIEVIHYLFYVSKKGQVIDRERLHTLMDLQMSLLQKELRLKELQAEVSASKKEIEKAYGRPTKTSDY